MKPTPENGNTQAETEGGDGNNMDCMCMGNMGDEMRGPARGETQGGVAWGVEAA